MSQTTRLSNKPLGLFTLILGIFALLYVGKGFYHLTLDNDPGIPIDLKLRWKEQQYVLKGINPYEVKADWNRNMSGHELQRARIKGLVEVDPEIGMPGPGYPPWAYGTGLLFAAPVDWVLARWCFAIIHCVLLAAMLLTLFQFTRSQGTHFAFFVCSAVLCISSICTSLGNGQYGIVVAVLLLLAIRLENRPLIVGLLVGLALVKPTLSLPFVVILLIKRQSLSLVIITLYLAIATGFTWWMTSTPPLDMIQQMLMAASHWGMETGADLISLLHRAGLEKQTSSAMVAAIVVLSTVLLLWFYRRASPLTLFGICSVGARLWTYHRSYDNVILLFLLVALLVKARERPGTLVITAAGLLGMSLWLPMFVIDNSIGHFLIISVWLFALVVLLMEEQQTFHGQTHETTKHEAKPA